MENGLWTGKKENQLESWCSRSNKDDDNLESADSNDAEKRADLK